MTYRPNEFFANNWVYEGLVAYGADGAIEPALASSWTVANNNAGGQDYTFTLRPNVKFHDGAAWNCDVAKLNIGLGLFDNDLVEVFFGFFNLSRVPKCLKTFLLVDCIVDVLVGTAND